MVIGGYADRKVVTRFDIGELDTLKFDPLAYSHKDSIEVADTTDWTYFRSTTTERICKVRRDEVSDKEDQDTFDIVMSYFNGA